MRSMPGNQLQILWREFKNCEKSKFTPQPMVYPYPWVPCCRTQGSPSKKRINTPKKFFERIYGVPLTFSPAAARTILRHLSARNFTPSDFDLILTGDLGFVGSELLHELLARDSLDISSRYNDCGMMIFDRKSQDVHAGGSGCGCSASVLCGNILPRMASGELERVLFVATGALMSPTSSFQGESIPGVAHAVEICSKTASSV